MNKKNEEKKQWLGAIIGFMVGDALGVPAEFRSRAELAEHPITTMVGYGSHQQPAGTWSDDSSMVLATMEWLGETEDGVLDYGTLMEKFRNWLLCGDYTPYGEVFDCGISTRSAILNFTQGTEPVECGGTNVWENGNGSLMRILPVALTFGKELAEGDFRCKEVIYDLSALTHGHMRSKVGCLLYAKLVADLLYHPDCDKMAIVAESLSACKLYVDDEKEAEVYHRLWDIDTFANLKEGAIKSSGYVVDTLEAALWCFLHTDNYKDCVLKAVNLGDDTDTVAAVAGGLAGLYYGLEEIPEEWRELLVKRAWVEELVEWVSERR